jgi:hypothetical protein
MGQMAVNALGLAYPVNCRQPRTAVLKLL